MEPQFASRQMNTLQYTGAEPNFAVEYEAFAATWALLAAGVGLAEPWEDVL